MPATGAANLTTRAIIDANLYLVLATADGTGRPWSSPVYFAHDAYTEFLWVSALDAAHSRHARRCRRPVLTGGSTSTRRPAPEPPRPARARTRVPSLRLPQG